MSRYQEATEVLNTRLNIYYCIDKLDESIIKCEDASQRTTFETDISYYNGMVQGLKLAKKLIVEEGEKNENIYSYRIWNDWLYRF